MARSSSVINVSIIGDASKLIGAVGKADTATGGLLKSAAKVAGAGFAVKKGFDLVGDSLEQADRMGDATARLQRSIGKIDTQRLKDSADGFADIGASTPDMLILEATYADLAKSAGIAAPDIAQNAEQFAAIAVAAGLVHDQDPEQIIDAIGKAAGGATRGLKPYGVDLTEAAVQQRALKDSGKDNPKQLTDTELAGARVALMLESMNPLLVDAATGSGDLEQKQDTLGAKFETVGAKAGEILAPALEEVLDFIIDQIDAIPAALDGWGMLGDLIADTAGTILTPVARAADAVRELLGLLGQVNNYRGGNVGHDPIGDFIFGTGKTDQSISDAQRRQQERNGLGT